MKIVIHKPTRDTVTVDLALRPSKPKPAVDEAPKPACKCGGHA